MPNEFWQVAGFITLFLAAICAAISFTLAWFFKQADGKLGQDLALKFAGDGLHLLMTSLFGLSLLIEGPDWFWRAAYLFRILVLCYLVWAMFRFFRHLRGHARTFLLRMWRKGSVAGDVAVKDRAKH